jgi:hypothetical protein
MPESLPNPESPFRKALGALGALVIRALESRRGSGYAPGFGLFTAHGYEYVDLSHVPGPDQEPPVVEHPLVHDEWPEITTESDALTVREEQQVAAQAAELQDDAQVSAFMARLTKDHERTWSRTWRDL